MNQPLSDEQLHQLYRCENGLRQLHEATTRFNSLISDLDPALRQLPEFFLSAVQLDLIAKRQAHERALDKQRGSAMLGVLEKVAA